MSRLGQSLRALGMALGTAVVIVAAGVVGIVLASILWELFRTAGQ